MPWSNYEVMRRKRENRNVNVIEKNGAEKLLQTSSILTTILLKLDNLNSNCKKCEVSLKKQETSREHLMEDHKYKYV